MVSMHLIDLTTDGRSLFAARVLRLLAYGSMSVVLVLYLAACGWSDQRIGWLLTMTLLGDTALSLLLTTSADRWGRRRMLVAGFAADGRGRACLCCIRRFHRAAIGRHHRGDQSQRQ